MSDQTAIALPDFTAGVSKMATEILNAQLGEQHGKMAVARLMTAMRVAARRSPDILKCTPASVAEALAMCIMTEMLPGGSQPPVYLLPRNNKVKIPGGGEKWQTELQFQLSFRGMRQLASRAGFTPSVTLVYETDTVIREVLNGAGDWVVPADEEAIKTLVGGWELSPMERLRFRPGDGPRTLATLRGAFVSTIRRTASGMTYEGTTVLGKATIEKRRMNSDAVKKGWASPWGGWEEEMIFKTAVRYWAARTAEFDDVGRRAFEMHDVSENIIDTTATVVPQTAAQRLDAALGIGQDADPVDYAAENVRLNDRERVAVNATGEPVTQGQEQATPYAAFVATLAAKGIDAEALGTWWAETRPDDGHPRTWVRGLAEFAADVCADGSPILASFRAAGGGK